MTKIYYRPQQEFLELRLWTNRSKMVRGLKASKDCHGLFRAAKKYKDPEKIGEIHLALDAITVGAMVHEVDHAVSHWCYCFGVRTFDDAVAQEMRAEVAGRIAAQVAAAIVKETRK